ncbi:hypothetical protein BG005_003857, partial [Podila minutissima]
MYKSIILLIAIVFGSVGVLAESGSWCYNPQDETFWGQASAECCQPSGGHMASDRRCYGLSGND